jgi:hypothetical protein
MNTSDSQPRYITVESRDHQRQESALYHIYAHAADNTAIPPERKARVKEQAEKYEREENITQKMYEEIQEYHKKADALAKSITLEQEEKAKTNGSHSRIPRRDVIRVPPENTDHFYLTVTDEWGRATLCKT